MIESIKSINNLLNSINNRNKLILNNQQCHLNLTKSAIIILIFLRNNNYIHSLTISKCNQFLYFNFCYNYDIQKPLLKKLVLLSKASRKLYFNSNNIKKALNFTKYNNSIITNSKLKLLTINECKNFNIGGKLLFSLVLN